MENVAILLARGGSKTLKRKNVKSIGNKSLLLRAIESASSATLIDEVYVSTDDQHIANNAKKYGAIVPELRPAELATDDSPMIDSMKHTLNWMDKNDKSPGIILFMKVTVPFREDDIIDRVIRRLYDNPSIDSCFTVQRSGAKVRRRTENGFHQFASDIYQGASRQDRENNRVESLYIEHAGVACASRSHIIRDTPHYITLDNSKIDIVEISDKRSLIDIDDLYDFWMAKKIYEEWNPASETFSGIDLEIELLYGGND